MGKTVKREATARAYCDGEIVEVGGIVEVDEQTAKNLDASGRFKVPEPKKPGRKPKEAAE